MGYTSSSRWIHIPITLLSRRYIIITYHMLAFLRKNEYDNNNYVSSYCIVI